MLPHVSSQFLMSGEFLGGGVHTTDPLSVGGAVTYNFNAREQREYHHSFDYLAGGLGKEVLEEERRQRKLKGTYDLEPVRTPDDARLAEVIIKTAEKVVATDKKFQSSGKGPSMEEHIRRKKAPAELAFVWDDTHEGHPFYLWAKHCIEREVPQWEGEFERRLERKRKAEEAAARARIAEEAEIEDPGYTVGSTVEIVGLAKRPDLNGERAKVTQGKEEAGDRYEVELVAKPGTKLKIRYVNLMFAPEDDFEQKKAKEKAKAERKKRLERRKAGILSEGTRVMVHSLKAESAQWMNNREGVIKDFHESSERYDVELDAAPGQIKQIKGMNLKVCLPPGWLEYFDEHTGKNYYVSPEGKVSWKHPVADQKSRGKIGRVMEEEEELYRDDSSDSEAEEAEIEKEDGAEEGYEAFEPSRRDAKRLREMKEEEVRRELEEMERRRKEEEEERARMFSR